jgi:hypothetical protein
LKTFQFSETHQVFQKFPVFTEGVLLNEQTCLLHKCSSLLFIGMGRLNLETVNTTTGQNHKTTPPTPKSPVHCWSDGERPQVLNLWVKSFTCSFCWACNWLVWGCKSECLVLSSLVVEHILQSCYILLLAANVVQ